MKLEYTITATNNGGSAWNASIDVTLLAQSVALDSDDVEYRSHVASTGAYTGGTWTATVGAASSETLTIELFVGREVTDAGELSCAAEDLGVGADDTELTVTQNTWDEWFWFCDWENQSAGQAPTETFQVGVDRDYYPHYNVEHVLESFLWFQYLDNEEQDAGDPQGQAQVYDASGTPLAESAFVFPVTTTLEAETLSHNTRVTGLSNGVLKNINRVNDDIVALKGGGDYTGAYLLLLSDGGTRQGAEFVYAWIDFSPDQLDLATGLATGPSGTSCRFEGDPAIRAAYDETGNGPPGFGSWEPRMRATVADFANVASGTIEIRFKLKDVTGVKCLLGSADTATDGNYFGIFVNATKIEIRRDNGSLTTSVGTTVLSADTWYELKIVSNGTAYTATLDGSSEAFTNDNGDWFGDISGRDNVTVFDLTQATVSGQANASLDKVYVY